MTGMSDTIEIRSKKRLPISASRICATKCGAGTLSPYFHLLDKYIWKYTSRDISGAPACLRPLREFFVGLLPLSPMAGAGLAA
jgi:hypothetical protein